jgi:hypothetical protein
MPRCSNQSTAGTRKKARPTPMMRMKRALAVAMKITKTRSPARTAIQNGVLGQRALRKCALTAPSSPGTPGTSEAAASSVLTSGVGLSISHPS